MGERLRAPMDVGAFAKSDKRAMPTAETSLDEVYTPFTDETCSPSCVGHRDGPCSFVAFLNIGGCPRPSVDKPVGTS